MRISDWSSDVCSSDLLQRYVVQRRKAAGHRRGIDALIGALRIWPGKRWLGRQSDSLIDILRGDAPAPARTRDPGDVDSALGNARPGARADRNALRHNRLGSGGGWRSRARAGSEGPAGFLAPGGPAAGSNGVWGEWVWELVKFGVR